MEIQIEQLFNNIENDENYEKIFDIISKKITETREKIIHKNDDKKCHDDLNQHLNELFENIKSGDTPIRNKLLTDNLKKKIQNFKIDKCAIICDDKLDSVNVVLNFDKISLETTFT